MVKKANEPLAGQIVDLELVIWSKSQELADLKKDLKEKVEALALKEQEPVKDPNQATLDVNEAEPPKGEA